MKQSWIIGMLALINFLVGTSQFIIVGILDKIAASMGITIEMAGQLVTAFALASALGSPPFVILVSRRPKNEQLTAALVTLLVGIFILLVTNSFWWMMLSRAILGIGSGAFVAISYAIAASLAGNNGRAAAMSYISMGFSASLVLGVPLGRAMTLWYDWKWLFVVIGIGTLLAVWPVHRHIPRDEGSRVTTLQEQLRIVRAPRLRNALVLTIILFTSYGIVNTYTIPLLHGLRGMTEGLIGSALLALGIASLAGSKVGGIMADALGARKTILIAIALQMAGLVCFSLLQQVSYGAVGALLIWAMFAWVFGLAQSYQISFIAEQAAGVALSFNSAIIQIAFAIGAAVGGRIVSNYETLYIVLISVIVGSLAWLWAYRMR